MARPNPGDDSNPHSGEGGPRKTPAQLATDPAFTGTYARKRTRLYDLRDYGLTPGDGSGFKAAVTAALAQVATDGGGVVYIPGGTYLTDGWTEGQAGAVSAVNNVRFIGDDKGTVLRLNPTAPSNPVLLPLIGSKVAVEGIRFDANGVTNSTCVRVYGGTVGARIVGCSFDTPKTGGIYFNSGAAITNVIVEGNEFNGGRYGILTRDDVTLRGLTVTGNTFTGAAGGGDGIEINAPTGTAYDITITGNIVKDIVGAGANDGLGIGIAHAERVTIAGNTVTNCSLDGIHVEDASHNISVVGNVVTACGRSGVSINYGQGVSGSAVLTAQVVVNSNTVSGCGTISGTGGIAIEGTGAAAASDFIVTSNTVRGCGRAATSYAGVLIGFQSNRSTVAHNHVSNTIGDATSAGIQVTSADALVTGNTCYDDQGTPTQQYGLRVSGGSAVVRMRDNNFAGNGTAQTVVTGGTLSDLNSTPSIDQHALSAGSATLSRSVATVTTLGLGSNTARIAYFTAQRSETVTQVRFRSGSTAAGATPTVVQLGLYSVSSTGDLSLITSTANDTTLLSAANTTYTKAFQTSATLVAGNRYAVVLLVTTAAATPTLVGASPVVDTGIAPFMGASWVSSGSLVSNIGNAAISASGNVPYFAVVP